jgi:hypothetical protein
MLKKMCKQFIQFLFAKGVFFNPIFGVLTIAVMKEIKTVNRIVRFELFPKKQKVFRFSAKAMETNQYLLASAKAEVFKLEVAFCY